MLNRKLYAQLDIIGVLNGKLLCAQLEIIGELNEKLLCAQLDIIGVLNGKLGAQWEVMCSTRHYWYAQCKSILGAPWEVNGVHMVVVVNNIPNVKPAVIYMPFKSTLPHELYAWFVHGRLN